MSPTKSIVLNAHQLILKDASIYGNDLLTPANQLQCADASPLPGQKASDIAYDPKAQRVTLMFADDIAANENAVFDITFSGTINADMAGFYRSKYKPTVPPVSSVPTEGEHHLMFSTQFESCDARRAFPCFDEPNLKASFDVSIEIPENQTALSNMPEKKTKEGSRPGLKVVSFERTPVMSTYVGAFSLNVHHLSAFSPLLSFFIRDPEIFALLELQLLLSPCFLGVVRKH